VLLARRAWFDVSSDALLIDDARLVKASQFRCLGYVFEFAGDRELVDRLEALFVDLNATPVGDAHIWTVEVFEAHARVTVDGAEPGPWVLRELLAATVISTLTLTVIAACPTSLHLHAGAVVDDGRTILLLAPSGSGKSTLTCALVAAGACYRTDEVVAVAPDGLSVTTFPKPISVKRSGIGVVEELTGLTRSAGSTGWEIPASSFGSIAGDGDYPVTTLAFNTYLPSQSVLVEPLHRATAVRRILADSQDVELVGPDSLVAAAGLTRSAHCVQVTGGGAAEVADATLAAHQVQVEPGEVAIVPPSTMGAGPARSQEVHSIVIDRRAVLFTAEPHRLIELDEAQTLWWLLLDGTPFDQTIDEVAGEMVVPRADVAAAATAFLEAFGDLGVLHIP
jgi:energy-coupling factor transporter ATP-binding protein EcfA2